MSFDGNRKTEPQPLAADRPPDARQRGESIQAYRCFLEYLEHGNIRAAADALGRNRRTLERYSKRWRWPERARLILAGHTRRWRDVTEYEERHGLDAAASAEERIEREIEAVDEIGVPRAERRLDQMFEKLAELPPPELDTELEKEVDDLFWSLGG